MVTPAVRFAQLNERAVVTVMGFDYSFWTTVEVERIFVEPVSYCTLTCAEFDQSALGLQTLKIALGQVATVSLAGEVVLTGKVDTRQVIYTAEQHEVIIRIASRSADWAASTVDTRIDGQGGQFNNQNFQQIGIALAQPIQNAVIVLGNPPGADKVFDQFSVIPGETRLAALQRIAPMRNLHCIDDASGNLCFARPDGTAASGFAPSGFSLIEGQNILEARILMRNDLAARSYTFQGQIEGTNQSWGADASQSSGVAQNPNYNGTPRPWVAICEHTADNTDCTLRAGHELQTVSMMMLDCVVVVQGWLAPDGHTWFPRRGQTISVLSPMLLPTGYTSVTLIIKGVKAKQGDKPNEGTRTELTLTVSQGLGSGIQSIGVAVPNLPPAAPVAPTPPAPPTIILPPIAPLPGVTS